MRLICTSNIPFDMNAWKDEPIDKVFAGNSCIMAITVDGRVLQQVSDYRIGAYTFLWQDICSIAISDWKPGAVIGLKKEGTCMISKAPLHDPLHQDFNFRPFDAIHTEVHSWTDIVQVCASDAFFALDRHGRVHYSPLCRNDDYQAVNSWENIVHIATGVQNAVFGVTKSGQVLCAGANCIHGPHGDLTRILSLQTDAAQICVSGAECGRIWIIKKDGMAHELLQGRESLPLPVMKEDAYASCFNITALHRADGCLEIIDDYYKLKEDIVAPVKAVKVDSFAVGHVEYENPFVVALVKE